MRTLSTKIAITSLAQEIGFAQKCRSYKTQHSEIEIS